MAYLSHSGSSFQTRRRTRASLNWRLLVVLAANTVGWLLIAAVIARLF